MLAKTLVAVVLVSAGLLRPAHAVAIQAVSAYNVAAPFALANFGNAGITGLVSAASISIAGGIITFGQTTGSPTAGVYDGGVAGVAASAFNGTQIAPRNYLVAEPGGNVTISYSASQTQFQLLWGSIDSYNSLLFTRADGSSVTVSGNDILAADGGATSAFVTISGLGGFRSVTAMSSTPAFEFVPSAVVPEPATLALLGAAAAGAAWVRSRRKTKA